MSSKSNLSLVQIGITTKDRWEDLRNTLTKIVEFRLGDLRIVIFDDGSLEPCPFDVTLLCPRAEIKRFSEARGLVVRRNQIACEIDSKYYFSLDDDSFPVSGLLEDAVEFAETHDDMYCLSFPIYNPRTGKHQVQSLQNEPYKVRSFIGCGHLLHRTKFLALGGYHEDIVHQGEEIELAARAFEKSLNCYHFSGLQIYHLASNTGRNWHRMDYYGPRNTILWNDWFIPPKHKLVKQSRTLASSIRQSLLVRRVGLLRGMVAGLRDIPKYKAKRSPMPLHLYEQWKNLPPS